MSSGRNKGEIITFLADEKLLKRLEGAGNRSDFIRRAIRLALDTRCPTCGGTGTLSAAQRRQWEEFTQRYGLDRDTVVGE